MDALLVREVRSKSGERRGPWHVVVIEPLTAIEDACAKIVPRLDGANMMSGAHCGLAMKTESAGRSEFSVTAVCRWRVRKGHHAISSSSEMV
jgi:hypothetical protein